MKPGLEAFKSRIRLLLGKFIDLEFDLLDRTNEQKTDFGMKISKFFVELDQKEVRFGGFPVLTDLVVVKFNINYAREEDSRECLWMVKFIEELRNALNRGLFDDFCAYFYEFDVEANTFIIRYILRGGLEDHSSDESFLGYSFDKTVDLYKKNLLSIQERFMDYIDRRIHFCSRVAKKIKDENPLKANEILITGIGDDYEDCNLCEGGFLCLCDGSVSKYAFKDRYPGIVFRIDYLKDDLGTFYTAERQIFAIESENRTFNFDMDIDKKEDHCFVTLSVGRNSVVDSRRADKVNLVSCPSYSFAEICLQPYLHPAIL